MFPVSLLLNLLNLPNPPLLSLGWIIPFVFLMPVGHTQMCRTNLD